MMTDTRKAIVSVSGGKGSWATWKVAAQIHGAENTIGLFADTMMEDGDLYRFLVEGAANVYGVALPDWWSDETEAEWFRLVAEEFLPNFVWLADGRDVWQVFKDKRFLGNSRIDPCSKILKRDLIRSYIEERFKPDDVVCYIGIDWTEGHRFTKAVPYWKPYEVRAPLTEPEHMLDGEQVMKWLESEGIRAPRLYEMGFPHNNCGGFCVKAGQASFRLLLERMPERYAYHEAKEEELRQYLGKDVAIMTDRRGGGKKPMTMRRFRERIEAESIEVDEFDLGGCACFTPDDYAKDELERQPISLGIPTVRTTE
jgi:hypothetical protein